MKGMCICCYLKTHADQQQRMIAYHSWVDSSMHVSHLPRTRELQQVV